VARVNVDQHALTDARFSRLAELRGWADADHARGKMLRIWNETIHRGSVLPVWLIEHHLGRDSAKDLLECQLAQLVMLAGESAGVPAGDTLVRIRGTEGRTDWYEKKVKAAALGGKARAANANRKAGKFTSHTDQPLAGDGTSHADQPQGTSHTSAPAPAPAPALEEEDLSGKPDELVLAEVAIGEINRLAGTSFQADSKSTAKLCKALTKAKHTPDEALRVIAYQRKWLTNPNMRAYFQPSTLLALTNFEKYLDEIDGRTKPQAQQTSIPTEPVKRRYLDDDGQEYWA
jgi:uncharacterized phage protein (TIGR02220 family)